MKNKKALLLIAFILIAVICAAAVLYRNLDDYVEFKTLSPAQTSNQDIEADESNPAPDFTVVDKDGNEISLTDMRGKPVILNFWASWCGPCKSEMPDFDEAYEEYKDDIHFMMVNMTDGVSETIDSASSFIQSQGYSFPIYYDVNASGATAYGVYSIPTTFFIDAQGNLVVYAKGAIDRQTLQQGIDMIYSAA